jgi:hypothetical protein
VGIFLFDDRCFSRLSVTALQERIDASLYLALQERIDASIIEQKKCLRFM